MGALSYHTLDETALLAAGMCLLSPRARYLPQLPLTDKGMLLEETARTCLGDKGDLVFVEPEETSEEMSEEDKPHKRQKKGSPRKPLADNEKQEERHDKNTEEDEEDR